MNLYNNLLGLICSVFNAYSGALFIREERKKDYYRLAGFFSLGDNEFSDCIELSGKGVMSWIIKNNKPLLITNFDRRSDSILDYYSNGRRSDIKSFMGCPLDWELGVLCVDSKNKFSFTERDQKILHQFSQIISTLHNKLHDYERLKVVFSFYSCIQAIENLRKGYQKWTDFLRSFLDIIAKTLGFKYCLLATRDEQGRGYYIEDSNVPFLTEELKCDRKFSMDKGIVGWVFKNGKVFINDRVRERSKEGVVLFERSIKTEPFSRLICFPIFIYFKVRGVLILADDKQGPVSPEEERFISLVVDQLSLFLENLYLKNKLKIRTS